jgi:hypothetical protein
MQRTRNAELRKTNVVYRLKRRGGRGQPLTCSR